MIGDDRDLEAALAEALGMGSERTPPPERIAALRAQVQMCTPPSRQPAGEQPVTVPKPPPSRLPRRRDLVVGGIAASIGAVLGVGGAAVTSDDDQAKGGPPTEPVSFTGGPTGVTTEASLIAHTWGTELLFNVAGLPAGRAYRVTYITADGGSVLAGSFRSVADTLMKCRFNAAPVRTDLAAIVIIDPGGQEITRARLA